MCVCARAHNCKTATASFAFYWTVIYGTGCTCDSTGTCCSLVTEPFIKEAKAQITVCCPYGENIQTMCEPGDAEAHRDRIFNFNQHTLPYCQVPLRTSRIKSNKI